MKLSKIRLVSGVLAVLLLIAGCANQSVPPTPAASNAASVQPEQISPEGDSAAPAAPAQMSPNQQEHGHKAGAHGGIMVSLGRDSYHAEAMLEKGGRLRIYLLGQDETRVIDAENQTLKGFVKVVGDTQSQAFTLQAEPQEGDPEGRTSLFVGMLPQEMSGRDLDVTIPNLVISGERFRLGFQVATEQHDEEMPNKVENLEEQQLYLTSGGKYTEADIDANGRLVASVKFKGLKSSHDMFPKPGDKICPITQTKANPQFTWIVGGQTYEFCCPPCVDEFVKAAKSTPDEIQEPADYVKSP